MLETEQEHSCLVLVTSRHVQAVTSSSYPTLLRFKEWASQTWWRGLEGFLGRAGCEMLEFWRCGMEGRSGGQDRDAKVQLLTVICQPILPAASSKKMIYARHLSKQSQLLRLGSNGACKVSLSHPAQLLPPPLPCSLCRRNKRFSTGIVFWTTFSESLWMKPFGCKQSPLPGTLKMIS